MKICRQVLFFIWLGLVFQSAHGQGFTNQQDSLLNLVRHSKDDYSVGLAHSRLAWLAANSDLEAAMAHLDTARLYFTKLGDEKQLSNLNYKYGVFSRLAGNYAKAHEYMDHFMSYSEQHRDTANIANAAYQKAVIYSNQGLYENSLKFFLQTLSSYESMGDSTAIGFTLNGIGIIYKNLGKYPDAIENFRNAIRIHIIMDDTEDLSNSYYNLAGVYAIAGKTDSAEVYYLKALEMDQQLNHNRGIGMVNYSLGELAASQGNYGAAKEYFSHAIEIQEQFHYKMDLVNSLSASALPLVKLGEINSAKLNLDRALKNATESLQQRKQIHYIYYQLYLSTGNFHKSLDHYVKYTEYKEKIFHEENLRNINALQYQYESEKKDRQIAAGKLEIQTGELLLLQKNTQFVVAISIVVVLIVLIIGSWLFFRQRQKNKTNEIIALQAREDVVRLESLIKGEERERNRLARDLHDGINGNMAVIKYKISSINPEGFNQKDSNNYREAIDMLDNSVEQIRRISHNLAPPSLQDFDLISAIQQHCANMDGTNGIVVNFQHLGERIVLDKEKETAIYRIIQELINNIIRHSSATEALVQIDKHDNTLQITVEDNGKGFNTEEKSNGIGMRNINSRLDYLLGEMEIHSDPEGSSFIIDIDLKKHEIL